MRVSHKIHADFDDPNLVSAAGLVPTMALAQQAGLAALAAEHVTVAGSAGANPQLKVPALVAGMIAGADSFEAMGLLRHGAMGRLFAGLRAPTTLGTHLRGYRFGHVRQLDAVASRLLINLAGQAPLLPGGRPGGLPRRRRHHPPHLRLPEAGRGLRVLQGQRP